MNGTIMTMLRFYNRCQSIPLWSLMFTVEGMGSVRRMKEKDMGEVYQGLGGLSFPWTAACRGKTSWQNWSHNLAASCAQQTTTSKLVRQNASGMHESAPFREQLMKTFLGRGHSASPDPSLREGETLFPHPSPQFGARSSSPNLRTKTKIGTPLFETKLRPWPVVIIKTMIAAHYCYNVAVSSDYSHGAIAISGTRMPKSNNGSCRRMLRIRRIESIKRTYFANTIARRCIRAIGWHSFCRCFERSQINHAPYFVSVRNRAQKRRIIPTHNFRSGVYKQSYYIYYIH